MRDGLQKNIGRHFVLSVFIVMLAGLYLVGCRGNNKNTEKNLKDSKIVVLFPGETGDLSWNDMNYEGVQICRKKYGIDIKCEFNVQEAEFEMILKRYGDNGYDLILASGMQFSEAVNIVASKYPDTTFCIINGNKCEHSNIALINIKEYESSYLASIIAANIEENEKIGMIAGYPNSAMEKLLDVYEENMKELLQKRGIAFESSFRAYTNSWKDDNLGRKIANQMIDSGVDMLFVYTNEAGLGCIQAAAEKNAKIIGFCSNAAEKYPDTVIASVKFNSDKIYEYIFDMYVSDQLKGDNISIGIKEEIFEPVYSEQIPQEIRMKVSDAMK
ncbi:MAG: BMP family protein [Acetivibrio ethanolgignens]